MKPESSLKLFVFMCLLISFCYCKKKEDSKKPDWAKKDIRDFNDVDLERLYDQWEEDDEPLEPDELPEHLRPAPQLDLTKMNFDNPENFLQLSKKGKTVMAFVNIVGNPSRKETEQLTELWQSSLRNDHIICERFVIADDRAIFMFKDGSQAWDAKDFLVEQKQVKDVTIENKPYVGKYAEVSKDEL